MPAGELGERMSSAELSEWLAFDAEYGLPDHYFTTAQLGKAVLAPWSKAAPKAEDFVPFFAPPRRKQSTADHRSFFRALANKSRI